MSSPSAATAPGSPWLSPKTAPKTGVILADFGLPWPVVATWCKVSKEWSIPQIAPYARGESICWETEWEKSSAMKGWMPLPDLPNKHEHPICSATLEEWAWQAYRALQAAEVLMQCLAAAKVELCEATDAAHFLGNNDNAMAIRDALASWPNVKLSHGGDTNL